MICPFEKWDQPRSVALLDEFATYLAKKGGVIAGNFQKIRYLPTSLNEFFEKTYGRRDAESAKSALIG